MPGRFTDKENEGVSFVTPAGQTDDGVDKAKAPAKKQRQEPIFDESDEPIGQSIYPDKPAED